MKNQRVITESPNLAETRQHAILDYDKPLSMEGITEIVGTSLRTLE